VIRRQPTRRAAPRQADQFNDVLAVDEVEVTLSDGTTKLLLLAVDEASGFTVAAPLEARRSISSEELRKVLNISWVSWAGPPGMIRMDSHRAHLGEAVRQWCRENGVEAVITPPEAHNANPVVERRADMFKEAFVKVSSELGLTAADCPWTWAGRITAAQNMHTRVCGYSPTQFVFGRDPRLPASLLDDRHSLTAVQEASVPGSAAERANDIRRAAVKAVQDLDDVRAVQRSLLRGARTPGIYKPGEVVYYWRSQGTTTQSKRLQHAAGWRGPAVVVATQGTSRIYVASWGSIILVAPEQLRHASHDELASLEQLDALHRG
jgi:hypothetical protein